MGILRMRLDSVRVIYTEKSVLRRDCFGNASQLETNYLCLQPDAFVIAILYCATVL